MDYNAYGAKVASAVVFNTAYVSVVLTVGTSQVEARVGSTRLDKRLMVSLYNDGDILVFYGPSGVTTSGATKGTPIAPGQTVFITMGQDSAIYLISTANDNVIVQEFS